MRKSLACVMTLAIVLLAPIAERADAATGGTVCSGLSGTSTLTPGLDPNSPALTAQTDSFHIVLPSCVGSGVTSGVMDASAKILGLSCNTLKNITTTVLKTTGTATWSNGATSSFQTYSEIDRQSFTLITTFTNGLFDGLTGTSMGTYALDGDCGFPTTATLTFTAPLVITPPPPGTCAAPCVTVEATPGVPASSIAGPPSDAHPTQQVLVLPSGPGAQPVIVSLGSVDPTSNLSAADRLLCPKTGTKCSGQISVFAGDFSKYANKALPIQARIVARWNAKVPPGRLLMRKDTGGPPVQLAACTVKAGKYNTPCLKSEVVTGSAGKGTLTTTSTVYFVGTDPRFARHVNKGPDAPIGVKATAGKAKAVVLWKPPVVTNGLIKTYAITPHQGKTALKATSVAGSARTATVTGLTSGKAYTFTVVAKTAIGISLPSIASKAVKVT